MKKKQIEQCTRINLSTGADQLIRTMQLELPAARYYMQKHFGGKHRYDQYVYQLMDDARKREQSQTGEFAEYISPKGNRWLSYNYAEYFPKARHVLPQICSFVYYETYGSCGAFFPTYPIGGKSRVGDVTGATILTSHFFMRLSERTGLPFRSSELVRKLTKMDQRVMQTFEDGEVAVRFEGGYGFGIQKCDCPKIAEIRTYLNQSQLTKSQLDKCKMLNDYAHRFADGMWNKDVATKTYLNEELSDEEANAIIQRKVPTVTEEMKKKYSYDLYVLCHLFIATVYLMEYKIFNPNGRKELYLSFTSNPYFRKLSCTKNVIGKMRTADQGFVDEYARCMERAVRGLKLGSYTAEQLKPSLLSILKSYKY